MLFGASDVYSGDSVMQVTIAFNHFGQGLVQRMPRCRWGFFHVVNNDYTHWLMYAIGGSTHPTIISQGNRFIAPPNPACKEATITLHPSPFLFFFSPLINWIGGTTSYLSQLRLDYKIST